MRFIRKHSFIIFTSCIFLAVSAVYAYKKARYSDVKNWPSVEAHHLGQETTTSHLRSDDQYVGTQLQQRSITKTSYQYNVGGIQYNGTELSPNGNLSPSWVYQMTNPYPSEISNNTPETSDFGRWRTYYKPSNPEIAVLEPTPFKGYKYLVLSGISALLIIVALLTPRTSKTNKS